MNSAVSGSFFLDHNEASRAHFIDDFLVNIFLDNGLTQFFPQGAQFFLIVSLPRHAEGSFASDVTRKGDGDAFPGHGKALVTTELVGDYLASSDLEIHY